MGGSSTKNTKTEVDTIINNQIRYEKPEEIKSLPKKQYYSGKKVIKDGFSNYYEENKFEVEEFYLDKKTEKKKIESPKKKNFKEPDPRDNFVSKTEIIKLQQDVPSYQTPKKSPRIKDRNSICYSGEFSVKLQQNEINDNKEIEIKKSFVKDLSCFESLKVIGRGTFGKVVLVRLINDKQLLALKCMKKFQILKNKNIQNIKNEKKILGKINHPFIIKMRFTFQTKDKIFMAFDYYNGGELFFHLQKQRRFTEKLAKFYAAEIYLALRYLHSNNIIYRYLNVLFIEI